MSLFLIDLYRIGIFISFDRNRTTSRKLYSEILLDLDFYPESLILIVYFKSIITLSFETEI